MYLKSFSLARTLLMAGSIAGIVLAVTPSQAQNDPPPGSARLAHLEGNVSVQTNGVDNWGQAYNNLPMGSGDRVFTDPEGMGELQAGMVRAYFSPNADVTLVNNSGSSIELGVAQGSVRVASDGFFPGQALYVSTPNGGITITSPTSFRVDVYPDEQSTVVTSGDQADAVVIDGAGGFHAVLGYRQAIQLTGTNPVYAQPLEVAPLDAFEHWSGAIESHRFNSQSGLYVSTEMAGYDELDGNGDWQAQSDYGPIWFPHVQRGWAPYHNGHWVNQPFYGWTWVADEPWGAAPFHYGRWVQMQGRWGWIPGPREGHPVWSPAQVVFAGGVQVGGVGISVWFPLGPGEAYKPWYPCTPQYINQINITNIRPSPIVHVQNNYVNIVNVTNVTNITYVNRTVGVSAMNQSDFAAGRPAQTAAVKVAPEQIAHVQMSAPQAKPPAQPVILHPIVKPPAVQAQRPVLINHQGQQIAAVANAKPIPVAVKPAPTVIKSIPGHAAVGAPIMAGGKPAPVAAPTPVAAKAPPPMVAKPVPAPVKSVGREEKPSEAPPVAKPMPAVTPAKPEAIKPETVKPEAVKPEATAKPATAMKPETTVKPEAPAKPETVTPATKPEPGDKSQVKKDDKKKDGKNKDDKEEEKKTPPDEQK